MCFPDLKKSGGGVTEKQGGRKMKVIKKIAAIMFALVMVISMGANVSVAHAEEGAQSGIKGTITIDKAVNGQIYTIYKMLDLESYDPGNG